MKFQVTVIETYTVEEDTKEEALTSYRDYSYEQDVLIMEIKDDVMEVEDA
jgi:hypothetical protein